MTCLEALWESDFLWYALVVVGFILWIAPAKGQRNGNE